MHDGRIHPTRIEEIVEKVKMDIEKLMIEEAEKIIFELGLSGFHPELVKVLGRLKYRTSYGQNNLYHAREAAYICGIMASELGLDVKLARRGALLHDIGKAVSHRGRGTPAMLGAEIAKNMAKIRDLMPSRRTMNRSSPFVRNRFWSLRLKLCRQHDLVRVVRHWSPMSSGSKSWNRWRLSIRAC